MPAVATDTRRPFAPAALALSFWLAVALIAAKTVHWGWPWEAVSGLRVWVRDVLVSSHADVAFAAGFGLAAALLLRIARHRPGLMGSFLAAFGAFCVAYAVAGVIIFDYLRSPLTYPLLYLAGDMSTMGSSIGTFITLPALAVLIVAVVAYPFAVHVSSRAMARTRLAVAALVLAAAWTAWGRHAEAGRWSDRSDVLIAKNPHWEFVSSIVRNATGGLEMPALDATFPPEYLDDFLPAAATLRPAALSASAVKPRNVIVVVLESTATRYVSVYGGRYPVTPTLDRVAQNALVFDAFYAHAGFTANSLVSMTLALHPYMTWREYTKEFPEFPGDTAAQVLKPHGYRTAFVTAQFLDYMSMDRFLDGRGFDDVLDWKAIGKKEAYTSWGGDDAGMVDGTLAWIDRAPDKPFYAVLWTQQTHHPYDIPPGEPVVDFFKDGPRPEDDYDLGRYLNNVAMVDRELGRLLDGLVARGLDRDTVVLFTGDHGEAFGDPHATWGHGFRLYEEGVRVPLLVWSPTLFPTGRRTATVGGHADINATVADLVGVAPAPSWEGRSLLAPDRPPRTYFYAANDQYLLGVRENELKYIYNVTRGREELYDLAKDPDEQRNIAAERPDDCRRLRQRLAAWKHHAGERLAAAYRQVRRTVAQQ
jgi:lipoteichoic acid synthase